MSLMLRPRFSWAIRLCVLSRNRFPGSPCFSRGLPSSEAIAKESSQIQRSTDIPVCATRIPGNPVCSPFQGSGGVRGDWKGRFSPPFEGVEGGVGECLIRQTTPPWPQFPCEEKCRRLRFRLVGDAASIPGSSRTASKESSVESVSSCLRAFVVRMIPAVEAV